MHRFLVSASFLAISSVCQAAAPPFPLGAYVSNPNANDTAAEAHFETQFNAFTTVMRARPQFMNAFVDFTSATSLWPSNAGWTAWSWTRSAVVGTNMTPVIGVPMADGNSWGKQDTFFKAIVAGTYDTVYTGIVDAWASKGFKTLYLRLGYEFNGSFMPWYCSNNAGTQADWIAAFQHLAVLTKQQGVTDGITVYSVWNPAAINYTPFNVANLYPGDQFVDVIAVDAYSPLYPLDLANWATGGTTQAANFQLWAANAANRRHFWNSPSGTTYNPNGQTGVGWGLTDTIRLAIAHKKRIALAETGAGGNGLTNGPVDEPAFPPWLASKLAQPGVPKVAFVNIWDDHLSDGNWDYSSPTATKPQEAAAWAASFGAQ